MQYIRHISFIFLTHCDSYYLFSYSVFFAFKANFSPILLKEAYDAGLNFECVSAQELRHLLTSYPSICGTRILFTPNFASHREYKAVLNLFESHDRMENISIRQKTPYLIVDNTTMLKRWGSTIFANRSIYLRVDPGEDGHGHHAHVFTGSSSKFGITIEEIRSAEFQALLDENNITVIGLHMHKGSGISDAQEWARSAEYLLQLLPVMSTIQTIDVGGGLGVPYKPSQNEFNLSQLDEKLEKVIVNYPHISFVAEPGRFVAAECGVLLAQVTQIKEKNDKRFVGLSCGMNALIRPALYESYHHVVNISKFDDIYLREASAASVDEFLKIAPTFEENAENTKAIVADIVGPICETGDFIGKNRVIPSNTQEDDVILIDTVGAYGRVMASNYNMRPIGPDVFIEEDGSYVIIPCKETF